MAYTNRQPTLKRTYYRSFLLLVVIPLVLVFVCAEIVVSYIIRNSAIETIDAFQENIATTISGDVRDNALQLSHFVYTNDGEFIQTAVTVHRSRGSDWYIADQAMQRAFRTAMVPFQDILVGAFYMDRAGAVYMKDDVAIPEGQVREAERAASFYQKSNLFPAFALRGERKAQESIQSTGGKAMRSLEKREDCLLCPLWLSRSFCWCALWYFRPSICSA